MTRISIEFKQALDDTEKAIIANGFNEHATAQVGHDGAIVDFAYVAKLGDQWLGGLTARLFWGSLHIKHLYIEPSHRKEGIGKQLVEAAFGHARQNGCRFVCVETMSFQALDFYRKLGFSIDFSRAGYDRGTTFHYLSRDL